MPSPDFCFLACGFSAGKAHLIYIVAFIYLRARKVPFSAHKLWWCAAKIAHSAQMCEILVFPMFGSEEWNMFWEILHISFRSVQTAQNQQEWALAHFCGASLHTLRPRVQKSVAFV